MEKLLDTSALRHQPEVTYAGVLAGSVREKKPKVVFMVFEE